MGGGSATKHKTKAEVKKDLFKKASDNARALLKEVGSCIRIMSPWL